ncbi:hypothetical protein A9Y87_16700 [Salmonella enterica subsp. enterica]|nr:hypothetical protein A9Y87_16700 [Salmonella enterica subsp. enterica]
MLDAHANFLRSNPSYKVTVEGHADERGTPEYNISLGERRANAVKMTSRQCWMRTLTSCVATRLTKSP